MSAVVDTRSYPSTRRGSGGINYTVQKFDDGTMSCNCPGWRFWKDQSKPRSCSHLSWYAQGYFAVTVGEATRQALRGVRWRKIQDIPTGMLIVYEKQAPTAESAREQFTVIRGQRTSAREQFTIIKSPDTSTDRKEIVRRASETLEQRRRQISGGTGQEKFLPVKDIKVPAPAPARARITFDEEV